MQKCFVIQPFDGGKFDKRFNDVYKPAITNAGLEPYRVDMDPSVLIPIESIENGIKSSEICLADITADNPNVWYELGFAFALGRPVVMVCSEERTGKKYPFDIQHRSIIPYIAEAPCDFDSLRENLTTKIKTIVESREVLEQIAESDPVTPIEGLSQTEILVLAVIAGYLFLPGSFVLVNTAKEGAERTGITNMGFNIAIRKLTAKNFIEISEEWDEYNENKYSCVSILENGWKWIEENESRFVLHRTEKIKNEDMPF